MKGISRWCICIGLEHLLYVETEVYASVTEELIALTQAGQITRKSRMGEIGKQWGTRYERDRKRRRS